MTMLIWLAAALVMAPPMTSQSAAVVEAGSSAWVPAGTEVELMVVTEVSTRDAKAGTPVKLRLNKPVMAGSVTVLPVGAPAFGVVEATQGSGIALTRGSLAVRITHIEVGGRAIPLTGEVEVRGSGGKHDDVAKLLLVPFYAPFAQGNSAKLKAGELLHARLGEALPVPGEALR